MFKLLTGGVFLLFGGLALAFVPDDGPASAWLNSARTAIGIGANRENNSTTFRYAETKRGDLVATVSATGSLAPVTTVVVGTQVSGQVKELYADFNSVVKQGDVIALIDPITFEHAVDMAEAEVAMTRAALRKAEVTLRDARADVERKAALVGRGAGSDVDRIKAEAARDLAWAQLEDAAAGVRRSEAALGRARTDLDRTHIRAPVDGIIIQRNVDAGQTVAASLQAPDLFTIAQDLRDMQVHASIDESEIGRITPGQRVEFTVDAYPGRRFAGTVEQIRKQPKTVQNVVTYTVVVRAPNPDLLLLPGMTASARFIIAERQDVLMVPNAALRFKPPGVAVSGLQPGIWVEEEGGELRRIAVRAGLNDGTNTEISGEGLQSGMKVVTGIAPEKRSKTVGKRVIGGF